MTQPLLKTSLILSLGVALLTCAAGVTANTLRVMQGDHPLDEYAVGALRVALAHVEPSYKLEVSRDQMTQTRVIELIRSNRLDVMWLASNQEAEDTLLPVRFPLLKGLLGYRISIINPQNQHKFAAVRNLSDLRTLSFGQGVGWPDVDILRSNQLNVVTTSKYQNLFYMVEGGRFDGFPRGVLEPWVEIRNHEHLGLTVDSHVLMIYRLPFYLFVSPDNRALATTLHEGLERALANGAFDRYFYNHEMIKSALEKAKLHARTAVFHLDNPTLPRETPLQREDYWFDISTLQ